jgi:hypothetical protein
MNNPLFSHHHTSSTMPFSMGLSSDSASAAAHNVLDPWLASERHETVTGSGGQSHERSASLVQEVTELKGQPVPRLVYLGKTQNTMPRDEDNRQKIGSRISKVRQSPSFSAYF